MEFRDEDDLTGKWQHRLPEQPRITGFWEGFRWGFGDAMRARSTWLIALAAAVLYFGVTHG